MASQEGLCSMELVNQFNSLVAYTNCELQAIVGVCP